MNSTNRFLNRALILVIGVLLIAAGGVAIALALAPAVGAEWRRVAKSLAVDAPAWVSAPAVGKASWLVAGIAVVALLLVVLLIAFVLRQGRGHTSDVVRLAADDGAMTEIDIAVPRALLHEQLAADPLFVTDRVSAYRVRGRPMLKVSVTCTRGARPDAAAAATARALETLEDLLGTRVPALVQLSGGFRSRTTRASRTA